MFGESGKHDLGVSEPARAEVVRDRTPLLRREADAERLYGFFSETAILHILASLGVLSEFSFVVAASMLHELVEAVLLRTLFLGLARAILLELDASACREHLERALEIETLELFNKGEDVALGTTAEAVVTAARWRDEERRRLLVMEWAWRFKIASRLLELQVRRNDVRDGESLLDIFNG